MTKFAVEQDQKFVQAGHAVATRMNDEIVMMDVNSGMYFAITGSGTAIWELLAEPIKVGDIIEAIGDEFESAPNEDMEQQVVDFVSRLSESGLIRIVQ